MATLTERIAQAIHEECPAGNEHIIRIRSRSRTVERTCIECYEAAMNAVVIVGKWITEPDQSDRLAHTEWRHRVTVHSPMPVSEIDLRIGWQGTPPSVRHGYAVQAIRALSALAAAALTEEFEE